MSMYNKLEIIEKCILLNPRYIQTFREKLKITQSKLAKESGISQSHLSMLEKGKREATELIACAITYGLLKCYSQRNPEDPIYGLLDTLSLLKFEDALIELIYDIKKNEDLRYIRNINDNSIIILNRNSILTEIKKRLKFVDIIDINIMRGRLEIFGKYLEDKDFSIVLDCSDIRRIEKKFYERNRLRVIIQSFPKGEVPPIYGVNDNCLIIHCW
ncbi:transcriptional regulator, XRE family [Methanocaldococcus infernus ME]|uniref:Transcriptional regulator, XRE family n=2 Tax=Methanocaldococcus infernus TaxID=67760 RepID=D5VTQ7_METIM|nr:transcriptional regulator, XRE family [Methanocaldococcus infernus ME]